MHTQEPTAQFTTLTTPHCNDMFTNQSINLGVGNSLLKNICKISQDKQNSQYCYICTPVIESYKVLTVWVSWEQTHQFSDSVQHWIWSFVVNIDENSLLLVLMKHS